MAPGTTRAYRGAGILGLALLLWSASAIPMFWAFAAAWLVAWAVFEAAARLRIGRLRLRVRRASAAVAALLILAAVGLRLGQVGEKLLLYEGLRGVWENTVDRLRLERLPSLAPPIVLGDRPQELYVHAPQAERVSLGLGAAGPRLDAVAVGEGLFRVAYDPRVDGAPDPPSGPLEARLDVDGVSYARELTAVLPLAHPRWFCGGHPLGVAATVSEETDELIVVARDGGLRRFAVGDGPTDCELFDSGRRAAVSHRYGDLQFVDLETGAARGVGLPPFQERLALSPDAGLLAVAIGGEAPGVAFVDLESGERSVLPTPVPPDWIEFGPDRDVLILSSRRTGRLYKLARREAGWKFGAEPLLFGRPVVTLARSPAGDRVYVTTTDYRPDGTPRKSNHFIEDQILAIDVAPFEVTARRVTGRGKRLGAPAAELDGRGGSPIGLTVTASGELIAAFAGTDELWWLTPDLETVTRMATTLGPDDPRGPAQLRVPLSLPHGVVELAPGVFAVASPGSGEIAVVDETGTEPRVRVHALDATLDAAARERRQGEQAFYESTLGGISCQGCHPHATSDYSLHNIGPRILLEPLDIRGLARTAPYLRDASYPDIAALNQLAMKSFGGYRRDLPGRAEALEAYIFGLPRVLNPRALRGRDAALESRGAGVFVASGCTRCHAFPAFTNLSQHTAESIFPEWAPRVRPHVPLDVPSLLGVHQSAPFLNDRRAASLEDVVREQNPQNLHGDTADLDDEEVAALVYFLESI